MIKHFDVQMGGRKLTRTLETTAVTAKVINFSHHAEIAPLDANRFTHTDGAAQNCDRPFAF